MRAARGWWLLVGWSLLVACSSGGSEGAATGGGSSTTSPSAAGAAPSATGPRSTGGSGGCGHDEVVEPGPARLRVDDGGAAREVERVIPPGYDGLDPRPLLVSLHGFTSTIEQQDLFSGLPERAADRGYVLLTPQAADATLPVNGEEVTGPFWNIRPDETVDVAGARDDIGFLGRLIDTTVDELCIDPDRVYVTGNSNGAGMATTLACALPGRLAAVAPVSGINLAAPCEDLRAVSVVAFHGDSDPLVPYEGARAAGVELGNPPVEDAVASLARVAGCGDEPSSEAVFEDVTHRRWSGCRPGLDVELYTVLGGGHTWPGMLTYVDVERLAALAEGMELPAAAGVDLAAVAGHMTTNLVATDVMLDFFDAHPRVER